MRGINMTKNITTTANTTTGSKKLSLLLTLKALELAGGERKPIRQIDIANMVNELGKRFNLDICCDRKTVGRHLKLLTAIGYDVITVKGQGFYIKSCIFTRNETSLLKDLIETSSIEEKQKKLLLDKIAYRYNFLDAETLKKYFNVE